MSNRKRRSGKEINPYDLISVSEAAEALNRRPARNPRHENPYSLTRNRSRRRSQIPPSKRED